MLTIFTKKSQEKQSKPSDNNYIGLPKRSWNEILNSNSNIDETYDWDFLWKNFHEKFQTKLPVDINDPNKSSKEKYLSYGQLGSPSQALFSTRKYKLDKYLKTNYPLHTAITRRNSSAIALFAQSKIEINKIDPLNRPAYQGFYEVTPLFLACVNPKISTNTVKFLLEQGAIPQAIAKSFHVAGGVGGAVSTTTTRDAIDCIIDVSKKCLIYLSLSEVSLDNNDLYQAHKYLVSAKQCDEDSFAEYITNIANTSTGFRPYSEDEKNWFLTLDITKTTTHNNLPSNTL